MRTLDDLSLQEGRRRLYGKPHECLKKDFLILVKVIDIFGNDTSQAFDVEVS